MDNAGYMKSLSSILNSTGVIDIGRKSDGIRGDAALATGRIEARFHWFGTTADEMDRFIMSASGLVGKYRNTSSDLLGIHRPRSRWNQPTINRSGFIFHSAIEHPDALLNMSTKRCRLTNEIEK